MHRFKKYLYRIAHIILWIFPRNKKLWVFIGWHKKTGGEVFADNTKYFFLFTSQYHSKEITPVWIAKSPELAQNLRAHGYRSYYEKSFRGIWYQLRAGFFVLDAFLQPTNYIFSGSAKIIQLLHGKGMKKKGYGEKQDKVQNFIFNTSPFTESILPEIFKRGSQSFITGYSRNDSFFHNIKDANIDSDSEMMEHLYAIRGKKKIVMYAPTFRRGQKEFNPEAILPLADLKAFAEKHNIFFILSLHNKYRSQQNTSKIEDSIGFLQESDVYPIFKYVDILITDYSSSFADYLLLDKPLIFYPYDLEEYNTKEGLAADYNEITPGPKVFTYQDLKEAITTTLIKDEYTTERMRVRNLYHTYQDGNSSKRIWDIISSLSQ